MFELTDIMILQIITISILGASARVIWEDTEEEKLTLSLYIKKISMPVVVTTGTVMVAQGRVPYLDFKNKYEIWGFTLLLSFFGSEIFNRIKEKFFGPNNPPDGGGGGNDKPV